MTRTLVASDDFNRASLGSNWTNLNVGNAGSVSINSSIRAVGQYGTQPTDEIAEAVWAGAGSFTADQYSEVKLINPLVNGGAPERHAACARMSGTGASRSEYQAVVKQDSATTPTTYIAKIVSGTITVLYSAAQTWAANDLLSIECEGTTIRLCRNGTPLGGGFTLTDSSISTGTPGIGATSAAYVDDWAAGNLTAATPVLTIPAGAATGNTTANAGATIDTVSGSGSRIMYALARIGGSAASAATIKASGTQLAVTSSGAKSVPLTGLTNGASYSADIVYSDATLGDSNVVTASWTQTAAPVLSSPTNTPGSTTALVGCTTDVTSGTLYALARVGGSAASASTIVATGQTSTVSSTTPSRTYTGLTASTANYYVDMVQVSGVTTSNVVTTGPFTTTSSGDTTAPVLTGSIVIGTVSSTTIQISWSAGSDNVAVTSYEVSKDSGTNWTDVGNVLTYTFTGLTASTSYGLQVRAKDAAGNVSTPALSATQSTSASGGVGSINLNNAALYVFKKNNAVPITSTAVTFWVSDVTTGALVGSAITGLSTNGLGLVTSSVSNASMVAGTTYRLNYEFSSGEYGCVKLPAV